MRYSVHDILRRIVVFYTRKHKIKKKKSIFGYDLKLLSFLKMKHRIYKEFIYFQISYVLKNTKKNVIYLNNYMHFS